MKSNITKLCRPKISKDGKYALIPCVTNGNFTTAIVPLNGKTAIRTVDGQIAVYFDLKEGDK